MKTSIFIVTYAPDYDYLIYCLRSIEKYCRNFHEVAILVPNEDLNELKEMVASIPGSSGIPFRCLGGYEWPEKGMCWHMCQIARADEWCPDADFIVHTDPDCVFTAPVTPETFIINGKPILQYESFESIGARHPGVNIWQNVTQNCLPFEVKYETMRQHGFTGRRDLYPKTRALVETKTGVRFDDYVKGCDNAYPQSWCEFVTLGNVIMKHFSYDYTLVNRALQTNPDLGLYPIFQGWSHNPPDVETDLWYQGLQRKIVPLDIYKELGLT